MRLYSTSIQQLASHRGFASLQSCMKQTREGTATSCYGVKTRLSDRTFMRFIYHQNENQELFTQWSGFYLLWQIYNR